MSKHTPGPWIANGISISMGKRTLTYRPQHNGSHSSETEANARLIAQAPVMLEFIQGWAASFESDCTEDAIRRFIETAQELTARATGGRK